MEFIIVIAAIVQVLLIVWCINQIRTIVSQLTYQTALLKMILEKMTNKEVEKGDIYREAVSLS